MCYPPARHAAAAYQDRRRPQARTPALTTPRERLAAHRPRQQAGRVPRAQRRLLLRLAPGRVPRRAPRLRAGPQAHHRQRRRGRRRAGRLARGRPEGRAAGHRADRRRPRRLELPAAEEAPRLRVPPRDRPPAPAHQHLRRGLPGPQRARPGRAPVLPGPGLRLRAHTDHHRRRRRGRGRDVPRQHPRPRRPPARPRRQGRLPAGLLRQAHLPHRLGPAQRRDLRHGPLGHLHLRPHLPRRELQHQPPRRRVL